ncbi:MAG: alcohol dehydrogenase catalytic domain-containing protein [Sedimentisphaerales bacterium]|nr:alcohol dehydrogenase catalytic domain-containing protein [Sedimentisphaerales bacterium]
MKAAVLTAIRQIEIQDLAKPKIQKDNDVLLKLTKVGVCGSDVHYYITGRIGSQVVQFPFIVGHECAAQVVEVGPAVKNLKIGDNVAVDPAVVCHNCDQCKSNRENTCRELRFLGCPGQLAGCLCEYIVMPQDSLFPIDGIISIDQAVLSEPLAIGYYAVKQSQIKPAANVAILGAGPIGLSVLVSARANNVGKTYVTDKINDRLTAARKGQASWTGNPDQSDIVADISQQEPQGMDVVYECCGEQDALDQAVELLKPGGKLMLIGIPRADRVSFQIDKLRRKEITVINVRRQNDCVQGCIDMLAQGKVDVDFMVTHRFSLDQTQEAFELVHNYADGVIKAMIEF